jgi:hypothetical protein
MKTRNAAPVYCGGLVRRQSPVRQRLLMLGHLERAYACVALWGDRHPELARPVQVHVVEVEPLRLGVEVPPHVVLFGSMEHLFEVDRLMLCEPPAHGVGEVAVSGMAADGL